MHAHPYILIHIHIYTYTYIYTELYSAIRKNEVVSFVGGTMDATGDSYSQQINPVSERQIFCSLSLWFLDFM